MKDAREMTEKDAEQYLLALVKRIKTNSGNVINGVNISYSHNIEDFHSEILRVCRNAIDILRQSEKYEQLFNTKDKANSVLSELAELLSLDKSEDERKLQGKNGNDILADLHRQLNILEHKIFQREFDALYRRFDEVFQQLPQPNEDRALYSKIFSELTYINKRILEISSFYKKLPDIDIEPRKIVLFNLNEKYILDTNSASQMLAARLDSCRMRFQVATSAFETEFLGKKSAASTTSPQQSQSRQPFHRPPNVKLEEKFVQELQQQSQAPLNLQYFDNALIKLAQQINEAKAQHQAELNSIKGLDYSPTEMKRIKENAISSIHDLRASLGSLNNQWQNYQLGRQVDKDRAQLDRVAVIQIVTLMKNTGTKISAAEADLIKHPSVNLHRKNEAEQQISPHQIVKPSGNA